MKSSPLLLKILASVINVIISLLVWAVLRSIDNEFFDNKIWLVFLFYTYNVIFIFFEKDGREPGMKLAKTYYEKDYSIFQKILYCTLYTASFASLIYWIVFPLDIFILNMLCLQLPAFLMKRNTFHGLISDVRTMKRN
jgi:hypothetical protein